MKRELISRAAEMGMSASDAQAEKLVRYHELIVSANADQNLTRVPDDFTEALYRNYLDSLAPLAAGLLDGAETLIDVGAGAGLPGLPLAIMRPDMRVTLLDSLNKRVRFMSGVIAELDINAAAVNMRSEDAARIPDMREAFDIGVSRAVSRLNALVELVLPLVRVGGRMIAYKGANAREELQEASAAIEILGGGDARVIEVDIPGRDWRHSLCIIEKIKQTPEKYPRRAGIPEKRPLK